MLFINLFKQEYINTLVNTLSEKISIKNDNTILKNVQLTHKNMLIKTFYPKSTEENKEFIEKTPIFDINNNYLTDKEYTEAFEKKVICFKIQIENLNYEQKLHKIVSTIYKLITTPSQQKLCGLICKIQDDSINLLNPFRLLNILYLKQNFLEQKQKNLMLYAFYSKEFVSNPSNNYIYHYEYLKVLNNYLTTMNQDITEITNKNVCENIHVIEIDNPERSSVKRDTYVCIPTNMSKINNTANYDEINLLGFADTYVSQIVYPYSSIILFKNIYSATVPMDIAYSHGNIHRNSKEICYGNYFKKLENIPYLASINGLSAYNKIIIQKDLPKLLWLFRDKEISKIILNNYLKQQGEKQ